MGKGCGWVWGEGGSSAAKMTRLIGKLANLARRKAFSRLQPRRLWAEPHLPLLERALNPAFPSCTLHRSGQTRLVERLNVLQTSCQIWLAQRGCIGELALRVGNEGVAHIPMQFHRSRCSKPESLNYLMNRSSLAEVEGGSTSPTSTRSAGFVCS